MDGNTSLEQDSGRILLAPASDAADPAGSLLETFLFAMPGALDLIVCDEVDEQLPEAP